MTGPVAKAEAWVRVVPSSAVQPGKQADALVAGTRELSLFTIVIRKCGWCESAAFFFEKFSCPEFDPEIISESF
jgi:hypothetical protein